MPDYRDQLIAELEAELKQANFANKALKKRIFRLRKQLTRLRLFTLVLALIGAIAVIWVLVLRLQQVLSVDHESAVSATNTDPPAASLFSQVIHHFQPPSPSPTPDSGYNVKQPPNFQSSPLLQASVDQIVKLAEQQGLPLEQLSITVIDLKNQTKADYQGDILRFPASVAKLFWMVYFYAEAKHKPPSYKEQALGDLVKMIKKSDNEAASRILDQITETTSGPELPAPQLQDWMSKRQRVNTFFLQAGYTGLNINQKNFPVHSLNLEEPQGRDLQMRGDPVEPTRNTMSTNHAARLMYEIFTNQALSTADSQEMAHLLEQDLNPAAWKDDPYNGIAGFLGEILPTDIFFASKVGFTSKSRQEVAFIATRDGRVAYVLAMFGDDPSFADNWEFFPQASRELFQYFTNQP